ncbi:MAG TPA: phosphate transport system regulatory protein PhoU, partial [Bacteroidetes bacterium]|nr:phosphate transport system regulatory protein PhoU [Bacteroidota bacterium]
MSAHLQREIERLKKKILSISARVEAAIQDAVRSLKNRDPALAEKVIEGDAEIDRIEVEMEEDCLKVLALYQPVAADLRYVVAVLKINNDLERIGD